MKKCPFCKAQIEENARFCLYCMKPLVEKEVVPPARENRRLIWLLPMLTVFLIFGVLAAVLLMGDSQSDPPMADTTAPIVATDSESPSAPEETDTPTVTAPTQGTEPPVENDPTQETKPPAENDPTQETKPPVEDDPTQETKPPVDDNPTQEPEPPAEDDPTQEPEPPVQDDPTPPATEDSSCAHNYLLRTEEKPTCTQGGLSYYVCSKCEDVKQEKSPALGHQFKDATCELPKTCKVCQITEGAALGHSYKGNTCTRCGDKQNTDTNQGITYEYRLAKADDVKSDTYINDGNDIVITGVLEMSPTGEYIIPSYIDGKRVVAIMPYAFNGINVTTVVLGSTIRVVWEYAFFVCYDLTDIYFAGESLDVHPNAFEYEKPLTFHCSATCRNTSVQLYLNTKLFLIGAVWEEWNGEL